MKFINIVLLLSLTGCAQLIPGMDQVLDDYVLDEAIKVEVNKAAIQEDTDVKIRVDVINKDPPPNRS